MEELEGHLGRLALRHEGVRPEVNFGESFGKGARPRGLGLEHMYYYELEVLQSVVRLHFARMFECSFVSVLAKRAARARRARQFGTQS